MTGALVRLLRAHPRTVARLGLILAGFALARSGVDAPLRAIGLAAAAIATFGGARKLEASLRRTEERLRTERPRRSR